jgi:ribosomal protein S19
MIKTHNRDLVVVPQLVGMKIGNLQRKRIFSSRNYARNAWTKIWRIFK